LPRRSSFPLGTCFFGANSCPILMGIAYYEEKTLPRNWNQLLGP
jgi:hypothetical protein